MVEGVISRGLHYAVFDVSATGTLAYGERREEADPSRRTLGFVELDDPEGRVERLDVPPASYRRPRLSPDGTKVAVETRDDADRGTIWLYDLSRDRALRQLTFEGSHERPIWTPDGRHTTYSSEMDGSKSIFWMRPDGSGVERLTTAEPGEQHQPHTWSPSGDVLIFGHSGKLWQRSSEGTVTPVYTAENEAFGSAAFSPDGNWLAYVRGRYINALTVHVDPFPPTGATHRISSGYGFWPVW